jgi:glucose-6-phosphate isomerase
MLSLDLSSCHVNLESQEIKAKAEAMQAQKAPDFTKYAPNLKHMEKILRDTKKIKNIIVAGRGGSITSFQAVYQALKKLETEKKFFVLNSSDIDLMNDIKQKCPPRESLFICISRSGDTVDVIENLLSFQRYPTIIITERNEGALRKIVEKKGISFLELPTINGRFLAVTFATLLPLELASMDSAGFLEGLKDGFEKFAPKAKLENNHALLASLVLDKLEQKGFTEIFMPVYSPRLTGFIELITQLIHECVAKDGKGQTVLAVESPEAQHTSSQRFFGGRQNMAGFFIRVEKHADEESKLSVPNDLKDIPIKSSVLGALNGLPLHRSMQFEFEGTYHSAVGKDIPSLILTLDKITPYNLGLFTAFFQYLAVYSSWLRDVNPFDQPAVDTSKEISFELRKNFKG